MGFSFFIPIRWRGSRDAFHLVREAGKTSNHFPFCSIADGMVAKHEIGRRQNDIEYTMTHKNNNKNKHKNRTWRTENFTK